VRILLVGDYPPDPLLGSTKVLLKLQEEFRSLGHGCDVLLGDAIGSQPRNRHLRQACGPVLARAAVKRMVRANGPYDVIDVASAEGLWLATGGRSVVNGAAVVSRSNGLEHLNYQRALDDDAAGLVRKPWTRRLFHPAVRLSQVAAAARVADRLLVLNELDREYAVRQRWKDPSRIDVVGHGVSQRFLGDAPSTAETRGAGILYCGSWTHVKGIAYLVDAFARLAQSRPGVRLTVLGGALPRDQILQAFPEHARQRLTIVDRVPEDGVMAAYRRHDVLAWPSTYEGYGMVLLEAMSQCLPVVATPVGCARSLVAPDETGILVPARDGAALAAGLARMLDDATFARRCAAAAFDRVQPLTWSRTAAKTLEVYERAIHGRHERVH
jgi:glycosyltransferase involved in cell wall biosynthesis